MKKFIMGLIVGVAITATGSVFAEDGLQKIEAYLRPSLPITLNGQAVTLKNPPVMYDGSTHLNLRDIAAITGLTVNWNDATQTVELVDSKGVNTMAEAVPTALTPEDEQNIKTAEVEIPRLQGKIEEANQVIAKNNKEIEELRVKEANETDPFAKKNYGQLIKSAQDNIASAEGIIKELTGAIDSTNEYISKVKAKAIK
jgi:hypothetical protein